MNIASYIDHTILKPVATQAQIRQLCAEAKEHQFAAVCINPTHIELAAQVLAGTSVQVCTVVGFPLGANTTAVKAFETADAIQRGATEIDMVINIGALKDGNGDMVRTDIAEVVMMCHQHDATCKVIIENALLTDEEKVRACQLAVEVGADYVKTSTGFSTHGARLEDVALMRRTVGDQAKIKAAGGVRSLADAKAMIEAGANRIGTSSGLKLMGETL